MPKNNIRFQLNLIEFILLFSSFFFLLFFFDVPPIVPNLDLRSNSTSTINSCTSSCVGHCPNIRAALTTSFDAIAPCLPVEMSDRANASPIFNNSSSENLLVCEGPSDFLRPLPFPPPADVNLEYCIINSFIKVGV